MKKILLLCLSLVLIFATFTACGEKAPIRSYEKVVHESRASRIPYRVLEEPKTFTPFLPSPATMMWCCMQSSITI